MKNIFISTVFVIVFLCQESVAEDEKYSQSKITISGSAKLYIPIDQVVLNIGIVLIGESPKELEQDGYDLGVRLKNLFTKYGITEKSIASSSIGLSDKGYYSDDEDKNRKYKFFISYSVQYQNLDLIDSLRRDCVELGVTSFTIEHLINNNRQKHKAKVRQMAFQNAQENAEAILQNSGYKLGIPILIDGKDGYGSNDEDNFLNEAEGLGAGPTPFEVREKILQQRQLYISDKINVEFSLK